MVPLFLGTLVGVVGGSLPGVTITMTVIVILPFTYGLDPLAGLAAMTGVYVGGSTGGLITCCLLGIPGSPASIATTFDGFPDGAQRRAGTRHLAGRVGLGVGRAARSAVPRFPDRTAGRHRAGVRAVGIFLAVRAGDGDGGGPDRSLAGQGAALDRDRAPDHRHRHRSDRQRAALHLRLGVHRRRLPVPARADRHLCLRPDHDGHRKARRVEGPDPGRWRMRSSSASPTSRSTGRSSASRSCWHGRPSSA